MQLNFQQLDALLEHSFLLLHSRLLAAVFFLGLLELILQQQAILYSLLVCDRARRVRGEVPPLRRLSCRCAHVLLVVRVGPRRLVGRQIAERGAAHGGSGRSHCMVLRRRVVRDARRNERMRQVRADVVRGGDIVVGSVAARGPSTAVIGLGQMMAATDRACPLLDHGEVVVLVEVVWLPLLLQMVRLQWRLAAAEIASLLFAVSSSFDALEFLRTFTIVLVVLQHQHGRSRLLVQQGVALGQEARGFGAGLEPERPGAARDPWQPATLDQGHGTAILAQDHLLSYDVARLELVGRVIVEPML